MATGLPQVPPTELLKSTETISAMSTSLSVQLTSSPPGTHFAGTISMAPEPTSGSSGCRTRVVLTSKLAMLSAKILLSAAVESSHWTLLPMYACGSIRVRRVMRNAAVAVGSTRRLKKSPL